MDTNKEVSLSERIKIHFPKVYCAQEKRIDLDEAKALVQKATREHLAFFTHDALGIRQMKLEQKRKGLVEDGVAKQENLSLCFDFWDKYIDRIQPPHIAQVHVVGQHVFYYTADEYQRLVLVEQEDLPNEIDTAQKTK